MLSFYHNKMIERKYPQDEEEVEHQNNSINLGIISNHI